MNCEALAEIVLDMARGAAVPEAARLSVRRHMEMCPFCAAEYARQRDLTTALQALAAEAQEWTAPAAMEQRLLAEFAAQQGREVPVVRRATAGRWRYALATAAALTVAVWGIREAGEPANRGTGELAGKAAAARGAEGSATGAPMVETARPPATTVLAPATGRTANPPAVSERILRESNRDRANREPRTATRRIRADPQRHRVARSRKRHRAAHGTAVDGVSGVRAPDCARRHAHLD